jgi:serine protease Do
MHRFLPLALFFDAGWAASRGPGAPAPAGAAPPPTLADVVAAADAGVVHVTTALGLASPPGSRDDAVGSGFVYDADGLVLTNRHVLRGAKQVHVSIAGRGTFEAEVLGQDEATDVALLRVPLRGLSPLPAGDARSLRVGDWVLAAGSPYHLEHSWSVGIVSGLHRSNVGVNPKGYEDFIQTDAAANLGNSGGPLLDASGRVVGMVTAILTRAGGHQGVTLATPIDAVLDAAARLSGRGGARPSLGAVVRELDSRGAAGTGLEVTRFYAGSAAEAAGLRPGDVIESVDGAVVTRAADLQRIVWAKPAGTVFLVVFRRGPGRFEARVASR